MNSVTQHDIEFKYRLGELTIWSAMRRLYVRNCNSRRIFEHPETVERVGQLNGIEPDTLIRSQPTATVLPTITCSDTSVIYVPHQYQRCFVDLRGSYEEYLRKFSAKSRGNLLKKLRVFDQISGGRTDWRLYKTPEQMAEFYSHARKISANTYQETMFDMGLPQNDAFQREMVEAAARDSVRAYLIFLQNQPVAYLYCPVHEGAVIYMYLGYLKEYAK